MADAAWMLAPSTIRQLTPACPLLVHAPRETDQYLFDQRPAGSSQACVRASDRPLCWIDPSAAWRVGKGPARVQWIWDQPEDGVVAEERASAWWEAATCCSAFCG